MAAVRTVTHRAPQYVFGTNNKENVYTMRCASFYPSKGYCKHDENEGETTICNEYQLPINLAPLCENV